MTFVDGDVTTTVYIDNGKLTADDTVERTPIAHVSPSLSRVLAFTIRPAA